MFCEAIPGLVLQAIAYLQAPEKTFVMTGSLLTSALSTAMTHMLCVCLACLAVRDY